MLTDSQIVDFCRAAADWHTLGRSHDISLSCPFDIGAVKSTRYSLANYEAYREDWKEPGVAAHRDTPFGRLHVYDNVRRGRGETRGTLFVMDFGDVRAMCFTGRSSSKRQAIKPPAKNEIGTRCRNCGAPLS